VDRIGTCDLVQESLAYRVFPIRSEWAIPKLEKEEGVKASVLVTLPYQFKEHPMFKGACPEWLGTIETMSNKILGNYTIKEDLLMMASFGVWGKQRMNRVMDALGLKYMDYNNLAQVAKVGVKRKRKVSIMEQEDARMVKEKKSEHKAAQENKGSVR
jgi:hypothetical protein